MIIAFTICSNNYLAQAKTLGESILQYNPDYTFIIGLVDKTLKSSESSIPFPFEIIEIGSTGIEDFDGMIKRYNITELNTAVKPYFFSFLFEKFKKIDTLLYFDPDIQIFSTLSGLVTILKTEDIVLTPHITTPLFDGYTPNETDILKTGLYNLGFIALKRSVNVVKFLTWWKSRLKEHCIVDFERGLFVDQIWINFVPIFFDRVFILKHPGYNMAYWNLHERSLSISNNQFTVNEAYPLVFFHFSGYNPEKEYVISKYQNRFNFSNRNDIYKLFRDYTVLILKNEHKKYQQIPCIYYDQNNQQLTQRPNLLVRLFYKYVSILFSALHRSGLYLKK